MEATPNPRPPTTTMDYETLWDEIEDKYFACLRAHRDQENRDLESSFRVRIENLKAQIIKSYDAWAERLRRLEALKLDYDTRRAELDRLDGEFEGVSRARKKERAREEEERRVRFRTYRRGGLAYRGVKDTEQRQGGEHGVNGRGENRGQPDANMEVVEVVEEMRTDDGVVVKGRDEGTFPPEVDAGDDRMADDGQAANGRGKGQSSSGTAAAEPKKSDGAEAVDGRGEGPASTELSVGQDTVPEDCAAVNGCDESRTSPEMETTEGNMADGGEAVNGRSREPAPTELGVVENREPDQGEAVHGQWGELPSHEHPTDAGENSPDTREPSNEQKDQPHVQPPADADNLPNGHQHEEEHEQPVEEETAHPEAPGNGLPQEPEVAEKDILQALPVPPGCEKDWEPRAVDAEMSGTEANEEPRGQQETFEHDMAVAPTPDHVQEMARVGAIGGPNSPEHAQAPTTGAKPDVVSAKLAEQGSLPRPMSGQETQTTEIAEAPAPSPKALDIPVSALKVCLADPNQVADLAPGEDTEMADAQVSTKNETHGAGPLQEPSQTMPTAAASPSSSSEPSLRNTTLELGTPISMPGEPSPPATPGAATLGDVEVPGESGERLAWLHPPNTSNCSLDRLRDGSIKRPVQIHHSRGFTVVNDAEDIEEQGEVAGPKKVTAPQLIKRKDPHQTPESTSSKTKATRKRKPTPAAPVSSHPQQKPKKIKTVATGSKPQANSEPLRAARKANIILNSPLLRSTTSDKKQQPLGKEEDDPLEYDGYTSTDSISDDCLQPIDWRLLQVRTRTWASNPRVTQYWHWVAKTTEIEHQVLESVRPTRWTVFRKPYDFHLKLDDVQEVKFARGSTRVVVVHKEGKDTNPRGDVMAQFMRERAKRRFLALLAEKGVMVVEVGSDVIEMRWKSISPEILPVPDSED